MNLRRSVTLRLDYSIAAAPLFPNLRRFPQGRGFKQWTGDDSKALMKVFLPAITGHVPAQMVRAVSTFMEFCYLVRRSILHDDDLDELDRIVARFHRERIIFETEGTRDLDGFSLPRQHSLPHYKILIREFGAPNGLCSSITESKHIKAVKEPWRRSNRYEALGQMLIINQRLDKLAAIRIYFKENGLLNGSMFDAFVEPPAAQVQNDDDDDGGPVEGQGIMGETVLAKKAGKLSSIVFNLSLIYLIVRGLSKRLGRLIHTLNLPHLPTLISRFLYQQENPDLDIPVEEVPIEDCPIYHGKIEVYPSAIATYFAPSDISGVNGMFRERIRSVASWRNGPPRRDCVFVEENPDLPGFRGLFVARVELFFRINFNHIKYPCALVTTFSTIGEHPCPETGMWRVQPDLNRDGTRTMFIIHVDTILRGAHLIGLAGEDFIPRHIDHTESPDAFVAFYVNKYIDHHAYEIAF